MSHKMEDGFVSHIIFSKDVEISEKPLFELLKITTTMTAKASYEPGAMDKIIDLINKKNTITIYPLPLFIMSPRTRIYRAKDIKKFEGYLSKFEPDEVTGNEQPEAILTIKFGGVDDQHDNPV